MESHATGTSYLSVPAEEHNVLVNNIVHTSVENEKVDSSANNDPNLESEKVGNSPFSDSSRNLSASGNDSMILNTAEDEGDNDSDCMVIVESEVKPSEDATSTSIINHSSSSPLRQDENFPSRDKHSGGNPVNTTLHSLPIHELKRKLAFCSVCRTQYQSHKQANLCLSKHGKRQCWLCLDVMANTKDSYYQHCVKHHSIGQSNDIVGCPYCQKCFDFRQGFNQHIVKVHFSEDTSYVSSTACLSPGSLVDIFTGQPRLREEIMTAEHGLHIDNELLTTTTVHTSGTASQISVTVQNHPTPNSSTSVSSRPFYEKDIATSLANEAFGGGGENIRETVIRETPISSINQIPDSSSVPTQGERNASGDSELTENYEYAKQLYKRSSDIQSSRIPLPLDETIGYYRAKEISLKTKAQEACKEQTSCLFHQSSQFSQSASMDQRMTKTPVNPPSADFLLDSNNVQHRQHTVTSQSLTPSASLMEIEKLVQGTGFYAKNQYVDSVNTMLRTVAQYGPTEASSTPTSNVHRSTLSQFLVPYCPEIYQQTQSVGLSGASGPYGGTMSVDMFKVPCNGGMKRRILTKWDEQDKRKEKIMVPSPVPPSMDLAQIKDFQVEIHAEPNSSIQSQSSSHFQARASFWKTILDESSSKYARRLSSEGESYPSTEQDGLIESIQPQQRMIARMDSHLQNVEPTNLNPYPLVIPNKKHHHQLLTATEVSRNMAAPEMESHTQYQHSIIRQVLNPGVPEVKVAGLSYCSNQYPVSRRRKSSTPIRMIPNPQTQADCIVVQNPFEEEELRSSSRRNPPDLESEIMYHPCPIQGIGLGGHVISTEPKFTAGGQIVEMSGRLDHQGASGQSYPRTNSIPLLVSGSDPHSGRFESFSWSPLSVSQQQKYYENTQYIRKRLKGLEKHRNS